MQLCGKLTRRTDPAVRKGIAGVSLRTGADRRVVDDRALSSGTARSGTGIPALFVNASQMSLAFGVNDALRSAIRGAAGVEWKARAGRHACDFSALREGSAGIR